LHDDNFQQQASAAQTNFGKINLTQNFTDQFNKVTGFVTDEDKAVAGYAVANRNRVLQELIGLPSWVDRGAKTGPAALREVIANNLEVIIGKETIDSKQQDKVLGAVKNWRSSEFRIANFQAAIKISVDTFQSLKERDDKRFVTCPTKTSGIEGPPETPQTADDWYNNFLYLCDQLANERQKGLGALQAAFPDGDINQLIDRHNALTAKRDQDERDADSLKKRIDGALKNAATAKPNADDLVKQLKSLQDDLAKAQGVAKFLGFKTLADDLNNILAVELPVPNATGQAASTDSKQSTEDSKRAQAAIGLALALNDLRGIYADQSAIQRVNSILLANAGARHQIAMAKLDMDLESDTLKLVDAEIDARLKQSVRLGEAQTALGEDRSEDPVAGFDVLRGKSKFRNQSDALAAWVASQDEGEIPYQIFRMKEVQILRAESVKEGQASAEGYEDLIKPILAELDAYGKGGLTTQTLVQVLGFAGVIGSLNAQ
jgi:hypothetical protein